MHLCYTSPWTPSPIHTPFQNLHMVVSYFVACLNSSPPPPNQTLICNVHTSQNVTAETSAGRQSIIQIIIFFNNMTFFKWPSSTLIKPNYGWSPHHIWVFQPMSAVWNAVSSHYIKFVYCLFIPYTIHQSGMLVCRPCIYCFLNCVPAVKLDFSSS